jgi:hypothetical protein
VAWTMSDAVINARVVSEYSSAQDNLEDSARVVEMAGLFREMIIGTGDRFTIYEQWGKIIIEVLRWNGEKELWSIAG